MNTGLSRKKCIDWVREWALVATVSPHRRAPSFFQSALTPSSQKVALFGSRSQVALLSLFTHFLPLGLSFEHLSPPLAAVLGGLLCGTGMLILFRHRASLGGLNILVLYLQERLGWRAGKVQMLMDGLIVLGALWVTDGERVALSVLGAVVLNLTLAINHRPGRYMAM